MEIKTNRKIILGVGIIISFALLIFSISLYFNYRHDTREESRLDIDLIDNMDKNSIADDADNSL